SAVVGESLEDLGDVCNPEGTLKSGLYLAQSLRKGQSGSLLIGVKRGKTLPKLLCSHAGNMNHLHTIGFAAGYSNGGARHFQKVCKESGDSLIGLAFNRRRSQIDLESVADCARDPVAFGSRMDLHGEACAVGVVSQRDHRFGRSPKMAVPIRAQVEP